MKLLVTGSAGHLGEALVRSLRAEGHAVTGLDRLASPFTSVVADITDRSAVARAMAGAQAVLHTATLHKPHVATHAKQAFVDTNISGTLVLLEEAVAAGVRSLVFTSTTSTFGDALRPAPGTPAVWVTEDLAPQPRNIYGVTKLAAEGLCELFARKHALPVLVLRTSRFFPEDDDSLRTRQQHADANVKANELLYRRVDIADVISAHRLAVDRAPDLRFGRYIISATTPFTRDDLAALAHDAPAVLRRHAPAFEALYAQRGWQMFATLDRVYVNGQARRDLGWQPRHDFAHVLHCLADGRDWRSELALAVGRKPYHAQAFGHGPYPVDDAG
jgi:UDP-glucose 4-epimerase